MEMKPDEIFNALCERFDQIRQLESDQIAEKRKLYRKMKLREALQADAEYKGMTLTEKELDDLVASIE